MSGTPSPAPRRRAGDSRWARLERVVSIAAAVIGLALATIGMILATQAVSENRRDIAATRAATLESCQAGNWRFGGVIILADRLVRVAPPTTGLAEQVADASRPGQPLGPRDCTGDAWIGRGDFPPGVLVDPDVLGTPVPPGRP